MKPSQMRPPLPYQPLPSLRGGVAPLPTRATRDASESASGEGAVRYYREIRHDLEHFFRRIEKPFRGTE